MKMDKNKDDKASDYVSALVANARGEIFDLEGYAALGRCGDNFFPLRKKDMIPLPYGSETMFLPDRIPLVWNIEKKRMEALSEDPWYKGERIFPLAAFNSPGYLITHHPAYKEEKKAGILPLFAYGAIGWTEEGIFSATFRIEEEDRQDLRLMPLEKVEEGLLEIRRALPRNRLLLHIKNCALVYSCPAAKNFFLGRYEAPLPSSRSCNARCLGCISLQNNKELKSCQNRIAFTPSPGEIAEIALYHIKRVPKAIVSFGQGCEGDPLLAAEVIEPALKIIRRSTEEGTINMNSNASLPPVVDRLFASGLDSIRVSINSTRKEVYQAYFRPKNYSFEDVCRSIEIADKRKKHLALNYLNAPGITDSEEEVKSLKNFLSKHKVDLIQWRNLNFDPLAYHKLVKSRAPLSSGIGMKNLVEDLKKDFPKLKHGYFNPAKEDF